MMGKGEAMAAEFISSPRNQQVKEVVRLRSRAQRDQTGLFLIEGASEVIKALESGVSCPVLYLCGEDRTDLLAAEVAKTSGSRVVEVAEDAYRRMAYRDARSGVIAVAEKFATTLSSLDVGDTPLILVAEALEKPGNLGTMLRTAEGAGADALIVCDQGTDIFNPNVVRASLGTVFWVPIAIASSAEAISWLTRHEVRIVASTPAASVAYNEVDLRGSRALVVGSEHAGLSEAWLEAGEQVVIPMHGRGDSLNAAASAAVLLYEAVRQRQR